MDDDAPVPIDDEPTRRVDESRIALAALIVSDPGRAAEIILDCRDLALHAIDMLKEVQERQVRVEQLALQAIRKAEGRPAETLDPV